MLGIRIIRGLGISNMHRIFVDSLRVARNNENSGPQPLFNINARVVLAGTTVGKIMNDLEACKITQTILTLPIQSIKWHVRQVIPERVL